MQKVYRTFFKPKEVTEIRALGMRGKSKDWDGYAGGKGGIVSGYFNDPERFAAAAAALENAKARGVYYLANPCNEVLLSRAVNRLVCPADEATTPDMYITCIRWFLVDLDTKLLDGSRRPKGVSASQEELAVCAETAKAVAAWLEGEMGFARAIRGFSGNGYHLLYRLPDLPNTPETHKVIVDAMAALAARFGKDDIDVSVVNPARIWKLYGTTGRKGDSTETRPHRKSYIFPNQPETFTDIPITALETLQKVAALAAADTKPLPPVPARPGHNATPPSAKAPAKQQATRFKDGDLGPINMERYLTTYGVAYEIKQKGVQTLYMLERCLFNPDHGKGEASIIVSPTGPLLYQCFHASCKDKGWKAARALISGEKPLAEFCAGYDPNWTPPRSAGSGAMKDVQVSTTLHVQSNDSENPLEPPAVIDPLEFFEKRGKRPVFVPLMLANYITQYLAPLVHTDEAYWRYTDGLWKPFPKSTVNQMIVHALKNHSQGSFIENTQKVLSSNINQEEEQWPNDPRYINLKNGVFDIETMTLLEHSPDFGHRQRLPVNYDPKAFSERWHTFLGQIFPDDETFEKRFILQQFFGYCLLRDCRYQKALFAYGTGSNGKSTVIDVLLAMIGEENTCSLTLLDLSNRFRAQFLQGKLVNLATETNTRDPVATELLKAVIVGDLVTAERKFGQAFQFKNYAKFFISMNDAPVIPDKSYGLARRILLLMFNRRFSPAEIIPRLSAQLIEEIDGVFNWAVEGLQKLLQSDGFFVGSTVSRDGEELMAALNPLLIFVQECCELNEKTHVVTQDLWDLYKIWCSDGHNRALGRNRFFEQIRQTFPLIKKTKRTLPGREPGDEREMPADPADAKDHRRQILSGITLTDSASKWLAEERAKTKKKWEE